MLEDIVEIISRLDTLEDEIEELPSLLSTQDLRLADLYHALEFNKLDSSQCWYLAKEMKQVLTDRRKIKNKITLGKTFDTYINRLINKNTRKQLLNEVYKKNKNITNKTLEYNKYSKEQLIELGILKGDSNE